MGRFLRFAVVFSFVACLAGCQYTDRRKASMEMNAMSVRFEKLVEQGKTTRDQEQKYIKAVSDMSLQLDRSVRGTTKANATRQNAGVLADTGVDPSAPVKISKSK